LKTIKVLKGHGWLRVRNHAATTARYEVALMRVEKTPPEGGVIVTGFFETEMPAAMGVGLVSAHVTLEDGSVHAVKITEVTARGAGVAFDSPGALADTL